MNSRDRNGLYGGGIRPCGSDMIAISRRKKLRSAYARTRYTKIVSMLVICAAAAIVVSAIANVSFDKQKDAAPARPAQTPLPPYLLWGYTGYTTTPISNPVECNITITNLRTGEVNTTNSWQAEGWPLDGYYEFDLANNLTLGYSPGDWYNVTAIERNGTAIGWKEAQVPNPPGGSFNMDVSLTGTVIPEFPMLVLPVTGMLALFVVVGLRRRGEKQ